MEQISDDELIEFMKTLKANKKNITRQQFRTIRGQAYAGDINGASGGVAFLLTLVTCNIYGYYWAYKQGERIDNAKNARGIPSSNSNVLYLILRSRSQNFVHPFESLDL